MRLGGDRIGLWNTRTWAEPWEAGAKARKGLETARLKIEKIIIPLKSNLT